MGDALTAEMLRAPIQTRRLMLRVPVASDLAAISRLINDPVIAANTGLIRYPYPVSGGRWWIASAMAASGKRFHLPFLLTLRSNPRLIAGAVGITVGKSAIPSLGYWVAKPYRRRGFASEAARALIDATFSRSEVLAIGASARTSNTASQRVLQAVGMQRIGRGRIRSVQLGRYVPTFIYRLERIAWQKMRPPALTGEAWATEAL
jgi:RimJ/RimL family protein N-acetyltransferase